MNAVARSALVAMLMAATLAGCAGLNKPMTAYEGPARPVAEVAVLELPEELQLLAVDGREQSSYLLGSRQQVVHILPGERVLTLRYVELFQLSANDHEVVRSRPVALRFEAKAGQRYAFRYAKPGKVEAAREFAKAPSLELLTQDAAPIASSQAIKSYAEGSLVDSINSAFEGGTPKAVGNLELLQDVWGRSTAEEREAFRRWLEQGAK